MPTYCHIYGQLGQTGDRLEEVLGNLADLDLVCDAEMPIARLGDHANLLAPLRSRGGLIAPTIYPGDLDPKVPDANWWKLSAAHCEALLHKAEGEFSRHGLGPLEAINTYTPGNGLVQACRSRGIRYLLGFCAPIVIEDGGWEIAHYGSPLSPFFVSDEDFRKPENPGGRSDALLMASMELRNPLVCLDHWSEGPWCPLNAQAVDRWLEPSEDPWPFLQIAEDWIRQTEQDGQPRLFHLNLQYFFAGDCYGHNRRALEWIARQRDAGRLVPVGLREWAARLKTAGGFLPQTTVWSGEMPGYHAGHRPGFLRDVLVDENLIHQAIWSEPEILPRRLYDYQRPWKYDAFQPDGSEPASWQPGAIQIDWQLLEEGGYHRRGELRIRNPEQSKLPPLAVWNLLAECIGPFDIETPQGWTSRIASHPSGIGSVVLLESPLQGDACISVTARFGARSSTPLRKQWGHLAEARTYFVEERPYTMIAAQTLERFTLNAIKENAAPTLIRVESLCGIEFIQKEWAGEPLELKFDGTRLACWHRLWDVTVNDFALKGVSAAEEELRQKTAHVFRDLDLDEEPGYPGYQLFGNIRAVSRWDRQLAAAAGKRELAEIRKFFSRQRPDHGLVCIEVHPGIFLPRGSITKVLGHEFDLIHCAGGYGFRELCVDYPQGWDWGVSAWVQWRWLKVRLEGLCEKGPHWLHLHAIDPEHRGLCQRIHLIHPEDPSAPHLCVESCWELPKGTRHRFQPQALCSIRIPDLCEKWPAIDVWINPVERIKMDNWIIEQGAPGLLSHLWVTRP